MKKYGKICKALQERTKENIFKARMKYRTKETQKKPEKVRGFVDLDRKFGRAEIDLKNRRIDLEVFRPASMDLERKKNMGDYYDYRSRKEHSEKPLKKKKWKLPY